jgi:hypothetical protein
VAALNAESGIVALCALCSVFAAGLLVSAQDPERPQQPAPVAPGAPPAEVPQSDAPAPAATPATPPADSFTFPTGAGLIFWIVKPEEVEGFELVWGVIRGRLAASDKAELRAMDAGLTIFREDPIPGQDASYVFLAKPAVPSVSYGVPPFLLYESGLFERAEADELFGVLQKATVRVNAVAMTHVSP